MLKIRWTEKAVEDLVDILEYIKKENPDASITLAKEIRIKVNKLKQFPFIGRPGVLGDVREIVIQKHFLISYRIISSEVQIIQVWHAARKR